MLEFRLSGTAKTYVKQLAFEIADKFHVNGVTTNRVVPHVTIIGPLTTSKEQKLVSEVIRTCMEHDLMTIKLSGFMSFGNWLFGNRVLGIKIQPSDDLELLRSELVQKLDDFCPFQNLIQKHGSHIRHWRLKTSTISLGKSNDI